ncbi:hypothetical protein EV130_110174 [Rhizobium azibense]|uniref:Uncharacterized protein n=1 Tax=Rhizobium azibense TaxID=1136135 RepID=A0A4R3QIZ1_9HYPH|nr:hypothetical protein [Rhizobium azibense]TCU21830.1 hypothetical protein EV130_110174 [Rhizobium azibense]
MDYSDTALRTIRAALLEFRSATRANGRKRSWHAIADELNEDYVASSDDDAYKALAEALRRFAAGTQTPTGERLDAVCQYLIDRKFLSPVDLKPAATEPLLVRALQEYFGMDDAADSSPPLAAVFVGSRKIGARTELSFLKIGAEEEGRFVVEEKLYSLPVAPLSHRRDAIARVLSRHGGSESRYSGWLIRARGQHCLFTRDDVTKEPSVHLIARLETGGDNQPPIELTILKSRDFGNPVAGYASERMRLLSRNDDPEQQRLARIKEHIWLYRRQEGSNG